MRIAVNARLLYTLEMEGIARYIYYTTLHMARDHPSDTFYLFYDRPVRVKAQFPSNVKHIIIPLPTRHPVLWYLWFEILIPIYLKLYKIDVFYSGDGYLSLKTKVPTVMVIHDLAYRHFGDHVKRSIQQYYEQYVPKFLIKANTVITVSEFVKKDVQEQFGIPKEKIEVAYNALGSIEQQHTQYRNKIKDIIRHKPYFIVIGALHPRKNIVRTIEAFEIFNKSRHYQYHLILVGRMAWKTKEIELKVENSEYIIHVGLVSESEKRVLLENSFCLLYVSLFEGFGIPIIEAMQAGIPVITSNVSSMPEIASGAALLADPLDIDSIAQCMDKLDNDPHLYQTLIKKGKNRVLAFDWKCTSEKIFTALENCVMK